MTTETSTSRGDITESSQIITEVLYLIYLHNIQVFMRDVDTITYFELQRNA
jgi:hypothetical protein